MLLLYYLAAAVGFSLGVAGRPLASAAGLQLERWRGSRAWKRLVQTTPSISGPGLSVMTMTSAIRKIAPNVLDPAELNLLFDAAWGSPKPRYNDALNHSYGWVAARQGGVLIGFTNIAWDGVAHFFLLDTTVHPDHRGKGVASMMTKAAIEHLKGKGEWLHVDATEPLMERLYLPCGFRSTAAGLIDLRTEVARSS